MGKFARVCLAALSGLGTVMLRHSAQSIHQSICEWYAEVWKVACPLWFDIEFVVSAIAWIGGGATLGLVISFPVEWYLRRRAEKRPKTIAGYQVLRCLVDARPNSYETAAIILGDAARLGQVRAWGRPRLNQALPLHTPAVEPIAPDIWAYAVLDASCANGPLPRSDMKYRQQFIQPYLADSRVLYDAVRFNRDEVEILCHAESALTSKRRGLWEKLINSPKSIHRKVMGVFGIY